MSAEDRPDIRPHPVAGIIGVPLTREAPPLEGDATQPVIPPAAITVTEPVVYVAITEEQRHDTIVAYFAGQEFDHWQHSLAIERFTAMLTDPLFPPALRGRYEDLLQQTRERLCEVTHLMEKTRPQLPTPDQIDASKARLRAAIGR